MAPGARVEPQSADINHIQRYKYMLLPPFTGNMCDFKAITKQVNNHCCLFLLMSSLYASTRFRVPVPILQSWISSFGFG